MSPNFDEARTQAFWNAVRSFLLGRPNRLLSWDEVQDKLELHGQLYVGVESVPIAKIVGSVERYTDFDRAFLPKRAELKDRWDSISKAFYHSSRPPPIELYRVSDAYFVIDGHHRISVARRMGVEFIDAEVIEVQSAVPLTSDIQASDLEALGERAHFLERTQLDALRPGHGIEPTVADGYRRLLEHIAIHRYHMEQEQGQKVAEEEAVGDWYDQLYRPLVQIMRQRDIMAHFPRRSEADLYLWIMEHQQHLQDMCGPQVSREAAAEHFASHRSERPLERAAQAVQDLFDEPVCDLVIEEKDTDNE
jgi:hypothetical protein